MPGAGWFGLGGLAPPVAEFLVWELGPPLRLSVALWEAMEEAAPRLVARVKSKIDAVFVLILLGIWAELLVELPCERAHSFGWLVVGISTSISASVSLALAILAFTPSVIIRASVINRLASMLVSFSFSPLSMWPSASSSIISEPILLGSFDGFLPCFEEERVYRKERIQTWFGSP